MEGASETKSNSAQSESQEKTASKAVPAEAASNDNNSSITATNQESYVSKASKYFFGYIFGTSNAAVQEDPEPAVIEEDECSEEETDSDEDEDEEEQAPIEVRSELVSLEDYCSQSDEEDSETEDATKRLVTIPEKANVAAAGSSSSILSRHDQLSRPVCKFFVQGSCRFGERCLNSHPLELAPEEVPAGKQQKKGSKTGKKSREQEDKTPGSNKRGSMKTALDVINRIEWDPLLPKVLKTFMQS